MRDIVARLRRDAGQLTFAELIQEREAAACEIERLRERQDGLRVAVAVPPSRAASAPLSPPPKISAERPQPLQLGALVRLTDVCKLVGLSRSSIYSRVGEGSFPAPVKLSDHCVRWRREDLEAWIRNPLTRG
jgi:prophage regulatory protein